MAEPHLNCTEPRKCDPLAREFASRSTITILNSSPNTTALFCQWNLCAPSEFQRMEHNQSAAVARYLLIQCCLSVSVGLTFGATMLAADIAGIRTLIAATSPGDALIFLAGSVMTLFPFVLTTAIGLLYYDPRE